MTDIPDEIIERCARAIFDGIKSQDGVQLIRDLDDEGLHWLKIMARAALTAVRYGEMREALKTSLCVLCACRDGYAAESMMRKDCNIAAEGCRSALSPEKDETT